MKINIENKNLKKEYDRIVVRKFKDMDKKYINSGGIRGNPIIYKVYIKDFGVFETGLTVVNPGTINGEYYMTKGHRHIKSTKEIYLLISGKGLLLVKGKKLEVFEMKRDITYILPKLKGHRLINIGNKPLEVFTIYSRNAGHDYNFSFDKGKRFFKKKGKNI